MKFEICGDQFCKDGKPIKLISGAVHYFRNLPETWPDIFEKLRAMGCNCVDLLRMEHARAEAGNV